MGVLPLSQRSNLFYILFSPFVFLSAGSKAAVEFSNGLYDLGSPVSVGPLPVLQLAEELRLALELQVRDEDRNSLRSQLPCTTAQTLMEWGERIGEALEWESL